MDNSVTLANWRTAPHSSQSFQNVDQLVPVSRIEGPERTWELAVDLQSLDSLVFEDHHGQQRRLPEVLDTTATHGLVVLKGGRLVAEYYSLGYDGKTPHILFSVSKSLTGAAAGILVDRGVLDPDSPVVKYVPEAANSAYGDCKVRHVLDMTVSSSFSEEYLDLTGDYIRYRRATLWDPALPGKDPGTLHGLLATLSRAPEPHGEVFNYLSPNSDFLGWILERASGRDFSSLFSTLVWQPMGAEADAYVTVDSEGAPRTAGGICTLPIDLARFGEMMRLGGKDIIPGWWVEDIRHNGDSGPWKKGDMVDLFPQGRYRSKWYQTGHASGAFCGIGIHGQWLWIDPRKEVVITKVSAQEEPVDDETDMLLVLAFEAIAEAVI
ncbi:6-aminohexanoate-dimer hydrolase (EC [Olavius sp. associated proteobacterium Delta 1]|nr:6-aminohexanoate-dimer hydrolase (EC [Olavius sp. associated proteobacterium Delta 1]